MLNASFESPFRWGWGNVPVTPVMGAAVYFVRTADYPNARGTCRGTGIQGTKAHADNLNLSSIHAKRGLPKQECPEGLCVMLKSDKPQASGKGDDTEYPARQRSFRSSLGNLNQQGRL